MTCDHKYLQHIIWSMTDEEGIQCRDCGAKWLEDKDGWFVLIGEQ